MTGQSNKLKQIESDIKILKSKYGELKSIESAERIMRVALFAEESLVHLQGEKNNIDK